MTTTTHRTTDAARQVEERGIEITSLELRTPDRRLWNLTSVPAGRGRRQEGNWGSIPGAPGGYRLFELTPNGPEEHDCADGDIWLRIDDLLDYLEAVGAATK
ncbi:MAG TPA: hypothetical protein PKC43_06350 [Phycisphaerales bacterium]|nr:hypothetical protein [Phycisphaerales bacterium]HMP37053.1 hypothetical protein [Phycisphaerales bacterium]